MSKFKTEQEAFWAGEFGDEYVDRNRSPNLVAGTQRYLPTSWPALRECSRSLNWEPTLDST